MTAMVTGLLVFFFSAVGALALVAWKHRRSLGPLVGPYTTFIFASFIRPIGGDSHSKQQDALESFYKVQVPNAMRH